MAPSLRPFRFGAQVAYAPSAPAWAATAQKVEAAGYSTLFMPDHLDDQWAPGPALAAAATATTSLRIGTLVLDNDYRHPVVMAKEAATLDVLSEGRLELGLGAGWQRSDYLASGIAFDPPGTRVRRLGEAVKVTKGLLSGEKFSFAGRHYSVTDMVGMPRPVQRPHPPILLGGGGREVLSLAGREADIVNVNFDLRSGEVGPHLGKTGTAAATTRKVGWIKEAAGDRFDALELGVTVFATVVTNRRRDVAAGIARGFGITAKEVLASPHLLVGTIGQMTNDLIRRRLEMGFSYVVFSGGAWEQTMPLVSRLAGT